MKMALQIVNGTPKDRKAKERARTEKASKCTDLSYANCSEDNPSKKELGGRWLRKIVERPWGLLSLFTTCSPLWVKSFHQSHCHVTYTGINSIHSQKTKQPYYIQSAKKNRTRMRKSAVEEDP